MVRGQPGAVMILAQEGEMLRAAMVAMAILGLFLAARAQAREPSITVSPSSGPVETVIEVSGDGFLPGDTVHIEMSRPGVDAGTVRMGTVTASTDGRITLSSIVGRDYFLVEPGATGRPFNLTPGVWEVFAYPESFGERTREALDRAPRTIFTVTQPGALPTTGGHPSDGSLGWRYAVVALVMLAGATGIVVVTALRRRSG